MSAAEGVWDKESSKRSTEPHRTLSRFRYLWSGYALGAIVCAIAYVSIFGWLIVAGRGVPYTIDGNETFSVYWHSYNLFHFDFWKSFGLSDDAYSPAASAHAVVHPHQGNWPRVFGFLIYILGARTVASQVIVTTFTVGLAAILFAYHFMARRMSPMFALLFCLVIMSDYVLYAQWHVVTYRVWHLFFFFSTLLCAERWAYGRLRTCVVSTVINYACLYYYELIFVTYLSVFAGIFTVYLYRRRPALLVTAVASQASGAAVSLAVLFLQLVGFYGLSGFESDFYYTFLGRNHAASLQSLTADMGDFYSSHNIAFFYNLAENTNYHHFLTFARSIFSYDLQTHTPLLSTLVLVLAVPALLLPGACWSSSIDSAIRDGGRFALLTLAGVAAVVVTLFELHRWDLRWAVPSSLAAVAALRPAAGALGRKLLGWPDGRAAVASSLASDALLALAFTLLFLAVTSSFLGDAAVVQDHWIQDRNVADAVMAGLLLTGATKWLAGLPLRMTPPEARIRVVAAALIVGVAAACLREQPTLYAETSAPLWRALEARNLPVGVFQLAITAALVLVARSVMAASGAVVDRLPMRELRTVLACGFIGYGFAFLLSAGYVFSGYLDRTTPFTVFLTDAVVAAAFYTALVEAGRAWRAIRMPGPVRVVSTAMAGGIAAVLAIGWSWQQIDYVRLLPPDYAAFLARLQDPPFRGASFAVNTYAAPMAAYTDQWAYNSQGWPFWASLEEASAIRRNGLGANDAGGVGSLPYLWMADRRTNAAYETPQYYMCFVNQSLATVTASLADPAGDRARGCGPTTQAVNAAARDSLHLLTPRVVAQDEEGLARRGWEAWSIVKLDWAYPPTLERPAGAAAGSPVTLRVERDGGAPRLAFAYTYAQSQGIPEAGSTVDLLRFGAGPDCGSDDWRSEVLASRPQSDGRPFDLPADFAGRVAVAVTPRTTEKAGRTYYSEVLSFGSEGAPTVCAHRPLLPGEPDPDQLAQQGYLVLGQTIDLRGTGRGSAALGLGWSSREEAGTWGVGPLSNLALSLPEQIDVPLRLTADLSAFVAPQHPRRTVTVMANGVKVATWVFDSAEVKTVTADIPASLLAGRRTLDISFASRDAVSPMALGVSLDDRPLTLLFRTLTIGERPAAAAYRPGEVVAFGASGEGARYTGQGWSTPEAPGTWAIGAQSSVSLSWPTGSRPPARLVATVMPFVDPHRGTETVDVVANGRLVARWSLAPGGFVTETADLPPDIVGPGGQLTLDFESEDTPSPASLGLGADPRPLKLMVRSLALDPAP